MNPYRTALCDDCQKGLETHEECEIHEVCKSGICILCFQSGKCDCNSYKPIYRPLSELIDKYGDDNLYYDLFFSKTDLGYVTSNSDSAMVKYSFIPVNESVYEK